MTHAQTAPSGELFLVLIGSFEETHTAVTASRADALAFIVSQIDPGEWAGFLASLPEAERAGLADDPTENDPEAAIAVWAGPKADGEDFWGNDLWHAEIRPTTLWTPTEARP